MPMRYHWKIPTLIVGPWLLGIAACVGLHEFFSWLDGRLVTHESGFRNAGHVLAVLSKSCFMLSVGTTFQQAAWYVVQRKGFSVKAIDAVFGLARNPMQIFVGEVVKSAWLIPTLAVIIWLIPLSTIPTTGALTIIPGRFVSRSTCEVQNLDLNRPPRKEDANRLSFTYVDGRNLTGRPVQPSVYVSNVATVSAFSGNTAFPPSPCGANCSYPLAFNAPVFRCQTCQFADTPWLTDSILWSAATAEREHVLYIGQQTYVPNPRFPGQSTSADMFFAYAYLRPGLQDRGRLSDPVLNYTDFDFVRSAFRCSSYNATYNLTMMYSDSVPSVTVSAITYLNPANGTITPYESMHSLMVSWLQGNITLRGEDPASYIYPPGLPLTSMPKLINLAAPFGEDEAEYHYPFPDLHLAVEELSRNATMSLLSVLNLTNLDPFQTTCLTINFANVFRYQPFLIWLPFGLAIAMATGSLGAAVLVVIRNGVVRSTDFSTFLLTTRTEELNEMFSGAGVGAQPMSEEVLSQRLQFGVCAIGRNGLRRKVGFGAEARVVEMTTKDILALETGNV